LIVVYKEQGLQLILNLKTYYLNLVDNTTLCDKVCQ